MDTVDDIIGGAGSAGLPIAARLSADPARRVALIEAGPDYESEAETPRNLLDGNQMSLVEHDWRFTAGLLPDRSTRYFQGKVAGGSSAVGNTIAIRGMPADFDAWAGAGNPEWAWPKVLPYLRAMENDLDFGGEFHGQGGPIPIRRWRREEPTPAQRAFYDGCLAAGSPVSRTTTTPRRRVSARRRRPAGTVTRGCRPPRPTFRRHAPGTTSRSWLTPS